MIFESQVGASNMIKVGMEISQHYRKKPRDNVQMISRLFRGAYRATQVEDLLPYSPSGMQYMDFMSLGACNVRIRRRLRSKSQK